MVRSCLRSGASSFGIRKRKEFAVTGSLSSDNVSENIITLEQDHLNQIGSCIDVTGRLEDLIEEIGTGEGKNNVVLDFQWIEKITSVGLNELIKINAEARRREVKVVLANVTKSVREILALTRLERLFDFEPIKATA